MRQNTPVHWGRTAAIIGSVFALGIISDAASEGVSVIVDDGIWSGDLAAGNIGYHGGAAQASAGFDEDAFEEEMESFEAEMETLADEMETLADDLDDRGGDAPEIEAKMESVGQEMAALGAKMAVHGLNAAFSD